MITRYNFFSLYTLEEVKAVGEKDARKSLSESVDSEERR